jgi:predicted DNA-binding protein YlxM (UPF0122 family)
MFSGKGNPNSKLTTDKVFKILDLYYNKNYKRAELEKEFLVSRSIIASIIQGKNWVNCYKEFMKTYPKKSLSQRTSEDMSESHSGKNNAMFGKKHSEETKRKISKKASGENNGMYGKNHSEKTKKKMSEKAMGKNNSMYNRRRTKKEKRNLSEKLSGENHPNSKLTEQDVRKIRKLYKEKIPVIKISNQYPHVSYSTIVDVVKNKSWKHIK